MGISVSMSDRKIEDDEFHDFFEFTKMIHDH